MRICGKMGGMSAMQSKQKTARASAAVMLVRGEGEGLEVFFVRRSQKLRFFGGSWAFPRGRGGPLGQGPPWANACRSGQVSGSRSRAE